MIEGNKIKFAIVEDEEYWKDEIIKRIRDFFGSKLDVFYFSSGEVFLKQEKFFEVVFMDIELGGKDGFDTSHIYKERYPNSIIIILTTHSEYCNKGYQVNAFRYLDKTRMEDMKEALESVALRIRQADSIRFHIVSVTDISIPCREIIYIETTGRNISVHTIQETFLCTGNITELAEELKDKGFYYIHRSYLVNVEYIKCYTRKQVTLKNIERLDMSVRRYKEFQDYYLKWKLL